MKKKIAVHAAPQINTQNTRCMSPCNLKTRNQSQNMCNFDKKKTYWNTEEKEKCKIDVI